MIYVAPDGIHVLELATLKTRLLVPNPPDNPAGTGRQFPQRSTCDRGGEKDQRVSSLLSLTPRKNSTSVYKADMYTGEVKEL